MPLHLKALMFLKYSLYAPFPGGPKLQGPQSSRLSHGTLIVKHVILGGPLSHHLETSSRGFKYRPYMGPSIGRPPKCKICHIWLERPFFPPSFGALRPYCGIHLCQDYNTVLFFVCFLNKIFGGLRYIALGWNFGSRRPWWRGSV